ncbi:hypothetical protein EP331_09685 [bacterium]|nr:MAG: hypothetical protein EP331_09685 [bacterium]
MKDDRLSQFFIIQNEKQNLRSAYKSAHELAIFFKDSAIKLKTEYEEKYGELCMVNCTPADYCKNGICDRNGCYIDDAAE